MTEMTKSAREARNAYMRARRKDPRVKKQENLAQIRYWTKKAEELRLAASEPGAADTQNGEPIQI